MELPSKKTGIIIICRGCRSTLLICRSCYRGHTYCSTVCRDLGYKERRKAARKRYAASPEAKLDHRDRNRSYRKRRKYNEINQEKTTTDFSLKSVTDNGSTESLLNLYSRPELKRIKLSQCQLCGQDISGIYKGRGYEDLELFPLVPD